MSTHEPSQQDLALFNQINGLIEVRKSKLKKLETIFIKGRSAVDAKQDDVSRGEVEHLKLKSKNLEIINALTDEYLGGDYQPADIQMWFAKERQFKSDIVTSEISEQQKRQELAELKVINYNQKQEYQQAMISCEKILILKSELSNE